MKKALLIVGHGSKSPKVPLLLQRMVADVRGKSDFHVVEGAHMEFCSPSIEESVEKLAEQNIKEIIIVPYFLYEGIHIQEDIPAIIRKLEKTYMGIRFFLKRSIGYDPVMSDLILKRAGE